MLKVIKPGILTTIQDQGRKKYRSFGVPISGVMDHYAASCANEIMGNSWEAAVIEITMGNVAFEVIEDTELAVTGADLNAEVDGKPLPMWQLIQVTAGSQLTFKGPKAGMRAYLALPGGIESERYLGSQSVYEKAGFGRALDKDDRVMGRLKNAKANQSLEAMEIPTYTKQTTVRVIPSHHEHQFTTDSLDCFYREGFTIKAADRMGCQLEGECLERKENTDILSEATTFGTIQVPSEGNPIILLADAQTTGGYPTIGTIVFEDLWRVAQMPPGGELYFERYTISEWSKGE